MSQKYHLMLERVGMLQEASWKKEELLIREDLAGNCKI